MFVAHDWSVKKRQKVVMNTVVKPSGDGLCEEEQEQVDKMNQSEAFMAAATKVQPKAAWKTQTANPQLSCSPTAPWFLAWNVMDLIVPNPTMPHWLTMTLPLPTLQSQKEMVN